MRVLALDAATEACSVALLQDDEVLLHSLESGKAHAGQLRALVEQVMAEAQLSLSMLDAVAASVGPGAFSGVRISVAVAQGLAYGANLQAVAVTTLQALAAQVLPNGDALAMACLDARMGEVYWGCFETDAARGVSEVIGPGVAAPAKVLDEIAGGLVACGPVVRSPIARGRSGRTLGVGRGFSAYPVLESIAGLEINDDRRRALPSAREIARLGALKLRCGGGVDPVDLQPVYLRDKVALTEAERAAR